MVNDLPQEDSPTVAPARNKALSAMVMVALVWLEVSGQIVLGLSMMAGTVALLLLPGALVALRVARPVDVHDLAGRDVWWIATRGRVPSVDQPASGLRPLPGPVPEEVLVQPPGTMAAKPAFATAAPA